MLLDKAQGILGEANASRCYTTKFRLLVAARGYSEAKSMQAEGLTGEKADGNSL